MILVITPGLYRGNPTLIESKISICKSELCFFDIFYKLLHLPKVHLKSIHILLADDQPLVLVGLRSFLKTLNENFIVHEAADGKEALEIFYKQPIDLLILDHRMPKLTGYEVAREILSVNVTKKIIIVSMFTDAPLISNLFDLGVNGFISKSANVSEVQKAIEAVMAGKLYYSKEFESILATKENTLPAIRFTDRELDLVISLSKGKTSIEIAKNWGISVKTVETYRSRLIEKTGVKNIAELIHYFHRNGQL